VYPKDKPEASDVIDGAIGELSTFHDTFGYYAHGVGEETAVLPRGWKERLVPIRNENTRGATGWRLEVHDLAASKIVAGHEKDMDFVTSMIIHRLADRDVLKSRINEIQFSDGVSKEMAVARLGRILKAVDASQAGGSEQH
jgi:hypothetical protein